MICEGIPFLNFQHSLPVEFNNLDPFCEIKN